MREHRMQNKDVNQSALIEDLIIDGLVQCRPIGEIAAHIDRLLRTDDAPSDPDLRLAS